MWTASFNRGFTLVELIVTLVIIGVLAAASAPVFFTTQTFQQRGFFNEVRSVVRYAQKAAVASGCPVQVAIAANTISLLTAATTGACAAGPYATAVADPTGGPAFTRAAPGGVTLTSVPATFRFQPLGNAVDAGGNTVNPAVTVGGQTFNVVGATGYVR